MYSCAFVGRSVMLSGIGFGFDQMMSERSHQPSAWSANATRQGMPTRFFGLSPGNGRRFGCVRALMSRARSPWAPPPGRSPTLPAPVA